MRWSQEVRPRPTLFGFMVPNQASNKHKCSLKWPEGKKCILVMQDILFSSKLCSPFQSSAKNRSKEPQPQEWCLEGTLQPRWCWMYFEENHKTVKDWFQGSEFGQDKTVGRTSPKVLKWAELANTAHQNLFYFQQEKVAFYSDTKITQPVL